MEPSPGDGSSPSPSPVDQPYPPSDPPDQPPTAHAKPEQSSGDQPAGPGAAGEALAVLTSFGRRLLVLVPVYLAGAMGLSVGFVLFGLALYLGWRRVREEKERSLRVARQLLDDEERLTAKTLYMSHRELPAWVSDHLQSSVQNSPPLAPQFEGSPYLKVSSPPWDDEPQIYPFGQLAACLLGRATRESDYPPPSARPDPDSSTKSGLLPPRLGKNSNNIWEACLRRGSSSNLPFQCPSLFLVPFTVLLGIPVPVAAQRVSSSFLSSPRLFFFLIPI